MRPPDVCSSGMDNLHCASLQRFEKLCRCVLSSMEAENEPKVSGVGGEGGMPESLPRPRKPACLALKVPLNVLTVVYESAYVHVGVCMC